jgi:hypothetical protein
MKRILSVLSILVISSAALLAQSSPLGGDDSNRATQAPAALTKHVLKGTYISVGSNVALGAGFTNVDAVNNVVCPGTSGNCLIQADLFLQVGNTTAASNRVAACFLVDGVYASCPYNGETLVNGHYSTYTYSSGLTVPHGTHTVQTQAYTDFGGTAANFNFTYRVYKP